VRGYLRPDVLELGKLFGAQAHVRQTLASLGSASLAGGLRHAGGNRRIEPLRALDLALRGRLAGAGRGEGGLQVGERNGRFASKFGLDVGPRVVVELARVGVQDVGDGLRVTDGAKVGEPHGIIAPNTKATTAHEPTMPVSQMVAFRGPGYGPLAAVVA
jgi:hypothetical protein